MSATDSNLSSIVPGFDYVVAVTQDSLNENLALYLYYSNFPTVNLCYCYESDTSNTLVQMDYATFVQNYLDPFQITDTPSDDQMQTLVNANFAFAIQAQLGYPPGVTPPPAIITLNPGQSNVNYTLMFSAFIAVELQYGRRGSLNTWMYQSQPNGQAWTFSGPVNLNLQSAQFKDLPAAIQNLLNGLSGATFSIQQLYYDLNSAALEQSFLSNLPSTDPLYDFMTGDFVDTYWKALGVNEVLGYGANQTSSTPASSLAVTSMNFFVPDVNNGANPLTLNYLCATNGDTLPGTSSAGFGWDWMEANEVSDYAGVAALNRNTFVAWLENANQNNPNNPSLYDYVCSNCYSIDVETSLTNVTLNLTSGQTATLQPSSGSTLLSYSYAASGGSESFGDGNHAQMKTSYTLTVTVSGNRMTIVQQLVIYCYVRSGLSKVDGNIVDQTITDTYYFAVDPSGNLVVTTPSANPQPNPADPQGPELPTSSNTDDNSDTPSTNEFMNLLTGGTINEAGSKFASWAQNVTATSLTGVPAAVVQSFVFPGGNTFAFVDVIFSDNQDLVAHIKYIIPSN